MVVPFETIKFIASEVLQNHALIIGFFVTIVSYSNLLTKWHTKKSIRYLFLKRSTSFLTFQILILIIMSVVFLCLYKMQSVRYRNDEEFRRLLLDINDNNDWRKKTCLICGWNINQVILLRILASYFPRKKLWIKSVL